MLVLALYVFMCSCAESQHSTPASAQTTEPQNLFDLLVDLKPEGLDVFEQKGIFTADNLYERINGRAELYLSYDVKSLTTITYEDRADVGRFIELSVFDMGESTNAFGIYSVERFQGDPPLDMGRMSYRSDANIYIWKGRYYIIVVTAGLMETDQQLIHELAGKVTDSLNDTGEPVWGLSAFPQKGLIHDSVQYFKVDAMGLDFMRNTYTAEYSYQGNIVRTFITQQASPESAQDLIEQYTKHSQEYGRGFERLDKNGTEIVLCDMGGVFDAILHKNRLVFGVTSVANEGIALEMVMDLSRSD